LKFICQNVTNDVNVSTIIGRVSHQCTMHTHSIGFTDANCNQTCIKRSPLGQRKSGLIMWFNW